MMCFARRCAFGKDNAVLTAKHLWPRISLWLLRTPETEPALKRYPESHEPVVMETLLPI